MNPGRKLTFKIQTKGVTMQGQIVSNVIPTFQDEPGLSAIWVEKDLLPVFLDGKGFAFDIKNGCGYQFREECCKWVIVSKPCRFVSLGREYSLNNRVRHNTGRNTS